jgi:cell division protein FtsI/penicillin-binding protein 2
MPQTLALKRVRYLYILLFIIGITLASRLYYLQVVRGDSYTNQALAEQQKKYEIPAERGRIFIRDGQEIVPLVLNETLKTLYGDPRFVEDPIATAQAIAQVIGGDVKEYTELLSQTKRYYVVLGKKLSLTKAQEIEKLNLSGIGLQDANYRSYPENTLAAQTIGFVNNDGEGQYGIEAALNDELAGEPGLLSAVTDVNGIPLVTSDDAIIKDAQNGTDIVLTLDRSIQNFVEQALEKGVKAAKGKSGSAIVMDPSSGAILAMANYPSYNPAKFYETKKPANFLNGVVSTPYEVGSVLKVFTMSAGLNEGAIKVDSTYYDAGYVQVDDRKIENAGNSGGVERTMTEVIQKSVNTGVVHVLKELGGSDSVNQQGRDILYDYFYNRFGFGSVTGIAQAAEASGVMYAPNDEQGNNVRYANMTFGQGLTLTMLQVASALNSLVNGGTYFQPYIIHSHINSLTGEESVTTPLAKRGHVVSEKVSQEIKGML